MPQTQPSLQPSLERSPIPPTARICARLALLGSAAVLAGCAAMSVEECRTANWHEQGWRDAQAGYPRARIDDLRQACAEAGVRPHAGQYMDGWSQGIRQFCTPQNGARWGREGKSYQQTCPPEIAQGFEERWRDGRRVWEAEQQLQRVHNEQRSRQRALDGAKDDAQRRRLREQLRDLDWQVRQARDNLDRAEWNFRRGY